MMCKQAAGDLVAPCGVRLFTLSLGLPLLHSYICAVRFKCLVYHTNVPKRFKIHLIIHMSGELVKKIKEDKSHGNLVVMVTLSKWLQV